MSIFYVRTYFFHLLLPQIIQFFKKSNKCFILRFPETQSKNAKYFFLQFQSKRRKNKGKMSRSKHRTLGILMRSYGNYIHYIKGEREIGKGGLIIYEY